MPRLIALDSEVPGPAAALRLASQALESGALVVLPTETVYGLCARAAKPEALDAIYELKGRPEDKALPFFVSGAGDVWTFCNQLPRRAQALLAAHWPGPLTLVVGEGKGVALRCPDHPFTRAVLAESSGPIAATSANRSGDPPATSAAAAAAAFADEEDLLIFDGGNAREGLASTVLRVLDDGRLLIFREGSLDRAALEASAPRRIAVVCTGNTCRSPMAAVVLREVLAQHLNCVVDDLPRMGFEISSAGVAAHSSDGMAEDAQSALRTAGFQVPAHRAQPFDDRVAGETDLVLTMTQRHSEAVQASFAGAILPFDPTGDVQDPFGQGPAVYAQTLDQLQRLAKSWADQFLSGSA